MVERVDLRGSEATLMVTLLLRARDAASAHPVLGDRYAAEVLERVEHDPRALRGFSSGTVTIPARARRLDEWTLAFLGEHPAGQVLHLGCGLDSRPLRLARPAGVRWVDVDLPAVADLRRRVYDLPDGVEVVGASASDPAWWSRIDADRPTLVLAEGLLMYLPPADVEAIVARTAGFPAGSVLAFDAVAGWALPVSAVTPEFRRIGTRFRWGWDAGLLRRHPTLHSRDDVRVSALGAQAARGAVRGALAAFDAVPVLRDAMRLHRLEVVQAGGRGPGRAFPVYGAGAPIAPA